MELNDRLHPWPWYCWRLSLCSSCFPALSGKSRKALVNQSLYQSDERTEWVCVSSSLRLKISRESQRIAPALWQMRKATVALAKVTGQMEAIPPEAGESSCDRGLLCHTRKIPVCVCLCIGYRDLTYKTIGISLLAVLVQQCVLLTYGETLSVTGDRAPLPAGVLCHMFVLPCSTPPCVSAGCLCAMLAVTGV